MSAADFAKQAKVTRGAVQHWLNQGEAPGWVLLAVEALHRRQGNGAAANCGKVVICRSMGPLPDNAEQILKAVGLEKIGEFNTLDMT